ncbi:MAG: hypothetical protein FWD78_10025 [Treponema sp.]|nr:hypothetical protein [Treponema sp.]
MKTFNEAIKSFKAEKKLPRMAIYQHEKTNNLNLYDNLFSVFCNKFHTEIVDSFFLRSYEALFNKVIDVLVIPEVQSLEPVQCYTIEDYLRRGGSLIIAGNDMLMENKTAEDVIRLKQESRQNFYWLENDCLTYYRGTIGVLGIKPYVSDVDPVQISFDTDFVKNAPKGIIPQQIYRDGAKCNTTSNVRTPMPYSGCAFAERYEVLRNYDIVTGLDGLGQKINSVVNFAENWETGARICVFPSISPNSFLDPKNKYYENVLNSAAEFCINKLTISYLMPQYTCYRQGEIPFIDYKVKSFYTAEETFEIKISVSTDKKILFEKTIGHSIEANGEITGTIVWNNNNFDSDIYEITAKILKTGRIVSKASNAFVVWNEEIIKKGIELKNDGEYFNIENRRTVVLGTNYYESNSNSHMWIMPNISKLNSDLEQMSGYGINFIRIHYHHPKWFYDFWKQRYNTVPEQFEELKNSYLPAEKYLRIFDAHVYLCQKYKIIYGGDLFTLVPEEMGDPRGWYGIHDYCTLEDKLQVQKEFLDLLIPRYKDVPGISWDIINEPYIGEDPKQQEDFHKILSAWEFKIKEHMVSLGEKHPIAVGNDMSGLNETGKYTGVADYLTFHINYKHASKLRWDTYKGPQFYHEVHMDADFTREGDKKQLEYMMTALVDCFRTGLAGFAPWQWTGQLAMWQRLGSFPGENWDDMLGCCVRHDGTLKPSGRFYKDFISLIGDLEFSEYAGNNKVKTKEGLITFKPVNKVKPGDYYFCLGKPDDPIRGIAKKYCGGKNFAIVSSCETANIFFDFSKDNTFLIKTDTTCRLEIKLPNEIKKAYITNGLARPEIRQKPDTRQESQIKLAKTNNPVIDVIPWQVNCWFKFEV